MKRENCFDSLRLVAAMAVLIGHSYELSVMAQPYGIHGDPLQRFTGIDSLAAVGVIMFFAISGYLVTTSLLQTRSIAHFVWKRCLRIFPALWVFVLIGTFLWAPFFSSLDYGAFVSHPVTLAYLKNGYLSVQWELPGVFAENPRPHGFNGSLWTLPIEFKLYVLLAFAGVFWKRHVRPSLIFFAVALYTLVCWHFFRGPLASTPYFNVPSLFVLKLASVFLLGSVIAAWRLERFLSWKWGAAVALSLCVVSATQQWLQYYLWLPFALAIGYATIAFGIRKQDFLSPITSRGDFSYGLYLWAFPVQQTLIMYLHPVDELLLILLSSALTMALAAMSWHFVEKSALKFKPLAVQGAPGMV